MTESSAEKIAYWMNEHRLAYRMLAQIRSLGDYYSPGYFIAWSERQALCYRAIERERNV